MNSELRDAHINLYGAYLELFRRHFSTYALIRGWWGKEMTTPELTEAIDAICENLRVICGLPQDLHNHFKREITKTVFSATKQTWVKK